jgi:XTP/dITP diphosphohydrolase
MRVLVATRSGDKLREIRAILRGVESLSLLDLNDAQIPPSEEEEGIEAHETFAENALAKAFFFHRLSGLPTVADDSGLVVDGLGGIPGVRSKRFAPVPDGISSAERDRANGEHLLSLLGGLELSKRTARYVCAAVFVAADGESHVVEEIAEGLILGRPQGRAGFGYDPLFFDPHLGKSFAELSPAEKDASSHRGKAFRRLAALLSSDQGAR